MTEKLEWPDRPMSDAVAASYHREDIGAYNHMRIWARARRINRDGTYRKAGCSGSWAYTINTQIVPYE